MKSKKKFTEVRLEDGSVVEVLKNKESVNIVIYKDRTFVLDAVMTLRDTKELAEALLEVLYE